MNKKAFTLVEILICVALFSLLGTVGMFFMSRGASNVARGSFNTIASNQAAFIISLIRSDVARSNLDNIEFGSSSDTWGEGDGEFKVTFASDSNKVCTYSIGSSVNPNAFVRLSSKGRKQVFNDFITEFTITRVEENQKVGFKVEIKMKESDKSNFPIEWNSTIYPPQGSPLDDYWKPLPEI